MANSSLERTGEKQPVVGKGHGTEALGPSDRSDTGSDITGAPGLDAESDTLHRQPGTTSDPDRAMRSPRRTAGPDVGDENLDSDTDSGGTGERAAAGRDAAPPNDQQLNIVDVEDDGEPPSAEDLDQELIEEDREFGDEAAPDAFYAEVTKQKRLSRERKAASEATRGRPRKSAQGKLRKSIAKHARSSRTR